MRRILWLDALQAAATSAAPVILAVLLDEPRLGWSAIAAFWACFGDPGGPLRQRAGAMLALGLAGGVYCLLASVSAPHLWLLLPLTFLCCTLGGLLRVLGPAAAIIGTLLSAGFVVAAELPAPTVVEPALRAVLRRGRILGDSDDGAGVAPPPWKDATLAVAHCYRGLADFADALAGMYSGLRPETGAPAWSAVSRSQRATLRAALEAARSRIGEVQGARPSRRTRAQQLYYLLDRAEDSFIAMVAAADLLESNAPRWLGRNAGAHLCHALHRYASVCNAIAGTSDAADARQADRLRERLERYGADLRELRGPALAHAPELASVIPVLDRLQQSAQSVRQALFDAAELPAGAASSSAAAPARQAWNTLRQNLRLESDALRHALRVGIGATLAVALSRSFAVNHGYWMSLTLVFILQPYFAATWQRTVERVLGSVAGAIGASLLGLLLSTPLSVALAVLPIALGTFAARTVNYALFTFFLTSQFVLVSHIQQPDLHEPELAALRAFNSVLGAVLALLIGFLLWPEGAPRAGRCAGARAAATCRLCAGARSGKERRGGGVAAAHRRAAPAGLPGGRQCPGVTGTAAAEPLAPRQQGRHGGSPAQCHAPGDRRRHRAGNPARAACRQRSGIPLRDYGETLAQALHPRDGEPEPGGRVMPVPSAVGLAQPGLPPLWNASPARRGRSSSCATSSNRPRACAGRGKLRPA